ncbi:unnamed protein product [Amoebophrya sp. A25]|nr:unnamed protein product [Amoebophrya sp. A25]|eukprot:GSA25T00010804001.1
MLAMMLVRKVLSYSCVHHASMPDSAGHTGELHARHPRFGKLPDRVVMLSMVNTDDPSSPGYADAILWQAARGPPLQPLVFERSKNEDDAGHDDGHEADQDDDHDESKIRSVVSLSRSRRTSSRENTSKKKVESSGERDVGRAEAGVESEDNISSINSCKNEGQKMSMSSSSAVKKQIFSYHQALYERQSFCNKTAEACYSAYDLQPDEDLHLSYGNRNRMNFL